MEAPQIDRFGAFHSGVGAGSPLHVDVFFWSLLDSLRSSWTALFPSSRIEWAFLNMFRNRTTEIMAARSERQAVSSFSRYGLS